MSNNGNECRPGNSLGFHSERDREMLRECVRKLLDQGSILGLESADSAVYQWLLLQNRDAINDFADLLSLKLHWDYQERIVQATPIASTFLLRLKLDATLVLLTLWYDFDTAVRDRGETPPITLSAQQLNDSMAAKFQPLRKHIPSPTRLREILSLAQRKNLLRFSADPSPDRFLIHVLPTLKRIIPFASIEEWCKTAQRYVKSVAGNEELAVISGEEEETLE
jgi:Domain of unknown function (DUF4194)